MFPIHSIVIAVRVRPLTATCIRNEEHVFYYLKQLPATRPHQYFKSRQSWPNGRQPHTNWNRYTIFVQFGVILLFYDLITQYQ